MKILIAEDDPNSLILLELILLSRDYDVLIARDGAEAWAMLQNETPDLIISDILMPGMDGFELCRKIRGDSRFSKTPIIIYSATYIEARDEQLAIAAGANRFVLKPIEAQNMIQVVAEVMSEAAAGAQARSDIQLSDHELDTLHINVLQSKLQDKLKLLSENNQFLQAQHEILQLALETSGMAAFEWLADKDLFFGDERLNMMLHGIKKPLRISHQEIIRHTHEEDREKVKSAFQRLIYTTEPVFVHFRYIRTNQTITMLEMHAKRHITSNLNDALHIVGTLMDPNTASNWHNNQNQSDIEYARQHDPLTDLPNRSYFSDQMDQCIQDAQQTASGFSIMMLDLDNFKLINDSLGHANGDKLIQSVGERIQSSLGHNHVVARLGGDEFAVILKGNEDKAANELARMLLVAISHPIKLAGQQLSITTSIGISHYPENGNDRYSLLTAADTAMYAAKSLRGNRVCIYEKEMASRSSERLMIEQGLKRALEQNQLELHYQPKLSLSNGQIIGVEALVRWRHPEQGLIQPDRFIAVSEENGMIVQIGRWVLRKACSEPLLRQSMNGRQMTIAVNVSVRQFTQDNFVEFLRATLDELDMPPEFLQLEVTESTLQVLEHSRQVLDEIRAMGISIAIDDFGTGYSSFSVLKHLPIDTLKIDRSFVKDIPDNLNDVAIVRGIVGLSRTLGLSVVAEGVETAEQLETLRQAGCDEYQGYYFSRPVPIMELEALLNIHQETVA
jgi:diguanylate cyclase (GGDEF)-like protein